MSEGRYIFFNKEMAGASLEAIRDALNLLSDVDAFVLPAPETGEHRLVYVEYRADSEFSADIWYERGEETEMQISEILDSLSNEKGSHAIYDGMISIVYNNEDTNVADIHDSIEKCLRHLVAGVVYNPETGEIK